MLTAQHLGPTYDYKHIFKYTPNPFLPFLKNAHMHYSDNISDDMCHEYDKLCFQWKDHKLSNPKNFIWGSLDEFWLIYKHFMVKM